MAPSSRHEEQPVSLQSRREDRWTLIINRPKGSRPNSQNSAIADESGDLSTSPQAETPTLQPWGTKYHPPTLGTRRFKQTSNSQTSDSPSNRNQTHVKTTAQSYGESNRELIGHPDILYKDYRKKRKREFLSSDGEDTSSSESESDLESLDSESDSTLHSESEAGESRDSDEETETQEAAQNRNLYPPLKRDLVEFIYTLFVIWMTSVRYIIPPDHRLKRTKRSQNGAKRTKIFIEEADPNDPSAIFISPVDGYYHLACPFYRYNASRYQDCTIRHALKSIGDLVEHIVHHHTEPPLCRICGKVFDNLKARNDHLRNEICEAKEKDSQAPIGVTQVQRVKILKRDNPRRTEEDRWAKINETIFEKANPESSPYLMEGEGYKFSLLHDYWKAKGKECVRKYLSDHGGEIGQGEEGAGGSRDFARLCSMVLDDLRRKVLEEEGQGQGGKE